MCDITSESPSLALANVASFSHRGDEFSELEFKVKEGNSTAAELTYQIRNSTYKVEQTKPGHYRLGEPPWNQHIITVERFHHVWDFRDLLNQLSSHLPSDFPTEGWDDLDHPKIMAQPNPRLRNRDWTLQLGMDFLSMTPWIEVTSPGGADSVLMFFIHCYT